MANFWDFLTREKEEEVAEQRSKRDLNVYLNLKLCIRLH